MHVELFFVCSPDDRDERAACAATRGQTYVVDFAPGPGDWAKKLNWAINQLAKNAGPVYPRGYAFDWYFLGADDLDFHPDWLRHALACHEATRACVIGTNDLGNQQVMHHEHSTHTLVHRRYLECGTIDDPTKLLHDGYDHNFVDAELIETAMHRETYAQALNSHVEHLHPHWGKGTLDATYEKGQAKFSEDRRLFLARRRLWR